MSAFTALTPWGVGEWIKATKLNAAQTAIGELQACATRANFDQTKSSYSWTSNAAAQNFTSWTTASGFTSSGAGLAVPADGVYMVTMIGILSSGSFAASTRYYFECNDPSGAFMHGNAPAGVSETTICVTGVTRYMTTSAVITPWRFQNTGSSITLSTMRLIIARIPVGG